MKSIIFNKKIIRIVLILYVFIYFKIKSAGEVTVQVIYTFTLGETPLPSTENEEQFKSIVSSTVAAMIGGDVEVTVGLLGGHFKK